MSLDFSDDFRFGAYISGPGFSGTAPSRSGLMAVMINSYKAQIIFARGSPVADGLPHATWAVVGRSTEPCRQVRAAIELFTSFRSFPCRFPYQCTLNPALMLLLLVGCPKSVTAVVTWSGP